LGKILLPFGGAKTFLSIFNLDNILCWFLVAFGHIAFTDLYSILGGKTTSITGIYFHGS